jgi:hypothetical protein
MLAENSNTFFLGNSELKPKRIISSIYLSESNFAYDIFDFKYDKQLKRFELKGLYHQGIRELITELGYFKKFLTDDNNHSILVKEKDNILDEVTDEIIKQEVLNYVDKIKHNLIFEYHGEEYNIPIENLKNVFLKQSNIFFNQKWLEQLKPHHKPVLKDTPTTSFIVFQNCFVCIDKYGVEVKDLSEIENCCVWREQQIKRDFYIIENNTKSEFENFCKNVTNGIDNRFEALKSSIGYLIHNSYNPSSNQAILLYDEALTSSSKPQGGTGKSLLANAIKKVRMTTKIDGKTFDIKNRFKFELVTPSTQVIWFDETKKDFDFTLLFSQLTDGWTIERKYLPQFTISEKESPKVIMCSNTILSNEGTSNKRRQHIIELNDYYSKKLKTGNEKPIEEEHGILFSDEWTQVEWDRFYSFMFDCVNLYFHEGLMPYNSVNVNLNLLKQRTCDEFVEWVINKHFITGKYYDSNELFEGFKSVYDDSFDKRNFTNWIKLFASSNEWNFEIKKSNGKSYYLFKE